IMASNDLVRGANPEISLHVLGERMCTEQPHAIVAADASRMVTDDFAQRAAHCRRHTEIAVSQHPRSCHPNPALAIFENGADSTRNVLLNRAILPTEKSCGSADPQGAVRRRQQGHDGSIG